MFYRICLIALALFSSFVSATSAENFGRWSLICGDSGNCSLSQIVASDPAGKNILLGANVNFAVSREFPTLMLRMPPIIYPKSGVGIKVDDNKDIQVAISQCTKIACQSVIKIDDILLEEFKNGKNVQVAIAIKKEKQLTLVLSLDGFNIGYEKLLSANKSLFEMSNDEL
jgi:invasion protein IalB